MAIYYFLVPEPPRSSLSSFFCFVVVLVVGIYIQKTHHGKFSMMRFFYSFTLIAYAM